MIIRGNSDFQLLAERMLSYNAEVRDETFLALNDEMDEHDDSEGVILQIVDKLICYDRLIQFDVLKEIPSLLGISACRPLILFLTSPHLEIRALVTSLLYEYSFGQEELTAISSLLSHGDQDVRSRAVELLLADGQEELVLGYFSEN